MDAGLELVGGIAHELALFAAIAFLIGGIDDLAIDLLWLGRAAWRRLTGRHAAPALPAADRPGWLAVFVPAWDEEAVIGRMLAAALARFDHPDYRLYIGCYPNDPETLDAVRAVAARDGRVRPVVHRREGPTTKADCLNGIWQALLADEAARGTRAKAVILHDAEDVVHPQELRLFDRLIESHAMVQIPVLPLAVPGSRWVSGHYLDEFAEAHGKQLVVREQLGAAVPAAGVGCAFARDMLERIARGRAEGPFDADSLTEDYELGLRISALGGRGTFARMRAADGSLIATRAYFPATLDAAVRQKARWVTGIALLGWERLGWTDSLAESWMRMRDRRAPLAAITIAIGYGAALLATVTLLAGTAAGRPPGAIDPGLALLININAVLLLWRMLMRGLFVGQAHGWREGLISIPRAAVANLIAILSAWRALGRYLAIKRGTAAPRWDKTAHAFPDINVPL